MKILTIDLETYSEVDIKKAGLYRYAENSEILLFAYAWDDEPVQIIDMGMVGKQASSASDLFSNNTVCQEAIPQEILAALTDPTVLKTAYNAAFERRVLSSWLDVELPPEQWFCTMVQGYTLGLPGGLDKLGKVIGIAEDKQKLATGKRLIQYFCKPCKPTKSNGGRTRNLPTDDFAKWELFKEYCKQDVEAERAIRNKLKFEPNTRERRLWFLDQCINDRGVLVDMKLVESALKIDAQLRAQWLDHAAKLTGLQNPNSNSQLISWINFKAERAVVSSLDKESRQELLQRADLPEPIPEVVRLKDWMSKTSVKKYEAMKNAVCRDGRVHGMLQFYGANRTGRWAGRLVQLHNLPQNHLEDLEGDRELVKNGDYEALTLLYDNPSDVLSQLIRTAFVAPEGHRFIVADFAAIEARVIAWLANEKWRLEAFANGEDIYCESASQMFHVPVVKHGINGELRAKGKIAELACGYGGGVAALKAFGADRMGMSSDEMETTIKHWRNASPNICKMWREVETSAKKAIRTKVPVRLGRLVFTYKVGILFITLPSGRNIAYIRPRIEHEPGRDSESLTYEGTAISGNWGRVYTWGGKLVENVVQATARDCLAEAMLRLDTAGYKIVMHVHDEIILEMPYGKGSLKEACEIMGQVIDWAPGLLLRADGYETEFYKKD